MSGSMEPGLTYHGVPVPVDVFRNDNWDTPKGEYWRQGVDDALEHLTPLLKPPVPGVRMVFNDPTTGVPTGESLCSRCTHSEDDHMDDRGDDSNWCSFCIGGNAHRFVRVTAP